MAVQRARESWSAGDYRGALRELDGAQGEPDLGALRDEAVLLRARSLYRLTEYQAVIALLGPIVATFEHGDASCTARMLLGTALARAGELDDGLRQLTVVAEEAESADVHRAIRAEIAHSRALAYYLRGEYECAVRFAEAAEAARADVISVRAMQLRGFVAVAQHRYLQALELFRSTLDSYRSCRERDDDLAQQTVFQISTLELTLRSAKIPGTHRDSDARRVRAWEPEIGPFSLARLQTAALDGWLYAHDGDAAEALRLMHRSYDLAPTSAWRLWALAQRAALANALGEPYSAGDLAAEALRLVPTIEWSETHGEERVGLLLLAEVVAKLDAPAAPALVERYDTLPAMDRNVVLSSDPRLYALDRHVRGVIARSLGDYAGAAVLLSEAVCIYRDIGNRWRMALSLIELDAAATARGEFPSALASRAKPERFYLEAAARVVREHFPRSFVAYRLGGWFAVYRDPVAAALPPHKREILRLMLAGLDNKVIAARLGRTYNTVRTYVADVHSAFATHSDRELFAECLRRGIIGPDAQLPDSIGRGG